MAFCLYCDEPFVPRQGGCDHHCMECCSCCTFEPYDHEDAADERYHFDREKREALHTKQEGGGL